MELFRKLKMRIRNLEYQNISGKKERLTIIDDEYLTAETPEILKRRKTA